MNKRSLAGFGLVALLATTAAQAAEKPIGKPVDREGMHIGAVYLQPVMMAPHHMAHDMAGHDMAMDADIHLETDVKALKGNNNGWAANEWVPYLTVHYALKKVDSAWAISGVLVPMVANDGPHYGENVKMDGPGKYHLDVTYDSPEAAGFYRHVDKETGVGGWWSAFTLGWDFVYTGTGKKGGY